MTKTFIWGTVAAIGPLRVALDGDTVPLPFAPDSLIDPLTLAVNDRVRCELSRNRVIVHGRAGGDIKLTGRVGQLEGRALSGLVPIFPSSVVVAGTGATASVDARGWVTFALATSLTIAGVFGAGYELYEADTHFESGDYVFARLINGTTPDVTALYQWQMLAAQIGNLYYGTGQFGQNQTSVRIFAGPGAMNMQINRPQDSAQPTDIAAIGGWGATSPTVAVARGSYNGNKAFTGMGFYPGTGTMKGRIRFYGKY